MGFAFRLFSAGSFLSYPGNSVKEASFLIACFPLYGQAFPKRKTEGGEHISFRFRIASPNQDEGMIVDDRLIFSNDAEVNLLQLPHQHHLPIALLGWICRRPQWRPFPSPVL